MTKQYSTTLIDPPWNERGGGRIKRGANHKYKTMKVPEIIQTIQDCPMYNPADNAHLYLCATNTYLIKAGAIVMPEIGFRYVTCLTWNKDTMSLGQYFRGETEHILFGVRGKGFAVRTDRKDLGTRIDAPCPRYPKGHPKQGKRIHSRKPDALYEKIEQRSEGPYLEIFATRKLPGWDCWGNEVGT
jgi:N6-adenosine-specific RNA methylase IME4